MPLGRLTSVDIERLRRAPREEVAADFKQEPPGTKKEREELADDVCAMANCGGGHIIIGVKDKIEPVTGVRSIQSVTISDSRIGSFLDSLPDNVQPRLSGSDLACYPVCLDSGENVVVITIQAPQDGRLRLSGYTAYTRVAGPSTRRMEESEISGFYMRQAKERAEGVLRDGQDIVHTILGELAWRLLFQGEDRAPADWIDATIAERAPEADIADTLRSALRHHPDLLWDGDPPGVAAFVSPKASAFYAARQLMTRGLEAALDLIEGSRHDDILLAAASLADADQLDRLVHEAIKQRRPHLALQCFLARTALAHPRTRAQVLDLLDQAFVRSPDPCMQALYLRELCGPVLGDGDPLFRSEALGIASRIPLSGRVVASLSRRVILEVQHDPRFATKLAGAITGAPVAPPPYASQVQRSLLDGLRTCNEYGSERSEIAPTRDSILVALVPYVTDPPPDEDAGIIREAIARARYDYEGGEQSVPLAVDLEEAIRRLEEMTNRSAAAPA